MKWRRLETLEVIICVGRYELLGNSSVLAHGSGELGIEVQRPMDLLFPQYYFGNLCALVWHNSREMENYCSYHLQCHLRGGTVCSQPKG